MIPQALDREEPRPGLRRPMPSRPTSSRPTPDRGTPEGPARVSDAELLAAIGRDLAAVYAEVLRQPLPTRVRTLLQHIHQHTNHQT